METVITISRRMDRAEDILNRLVLNAERADRRAELAEQRDARAVERADRADLRADRIDRQIEAMGQRLDAFAADMDEFKQENREMVRRNDEWQRQFQEREEEGKRKDEERKRKDEERKRENDEWQRQSQERDEERKRENDEWHRQFEKKREGEWRKYRQEMAQISHKMGTLVEDLVAPSIPRILREVVGCEEEPRLEAMRLKKKMGGRSQEYDTIAICGEYMLINETKSNLQPSDVTNFVKTLQEAREFLNDFGQYKIIGALATFYVDESLVVHGERQGLIMLNAGDGLMTVLNSDGFVPKAY